MATEARQMTIDQEMYERMAGSSALYERAKETFPSGVTHDARYAKPFPIYVNRAQGAASGTWTATSTSTTGGHGALFLGHCHPVVTQAVVEQAQKGTHYGACHELEVRWGELVQQIVPSAEVVKFATSGTEATMLAMRLARAFTGRDRIVKFHGHFHGWHDYAASRWRRRTTCRSRPASRPRSRARSPASTTRRRRSGSRAGEGRRGGRHHLVQRTEQGVGRDGPRQGAGARRAPDLRRGRHRLPLRPRRRAGVLRRHAGPDHARQDRGRRPARAAPRRPRRRHPPVRLLGRPRSGSGSAGSPTPAPTTATRSRRRPASPAWRSSGTRRSRTRPPTRRPRSRPGSRRRSHRNGVEGAVGGWRSYITTSAEGEGQRLGASAQVAGRDAAWRRRPLGHEPDRLGVHNDEDVARTVAAYESAIQRLQAEGLI